MLELLLGNTVAAAVLALVVFLFCRLVRPGPATRHALWFLVVFKLLSPLGLLWKAPLPFEQPALLNEKAQMNSSAPVANGATPAEPVVVYLTSRPTDGEPVRVGANTAETIAFATASPTHSTIVGQSEPVPPLRQTLYLWFLIIWCAGAVIVAWRYLRRTIRFASHVRQGKDPSPSLQRQVDELARVLGIRPPSVRILEKLPSPVVWSVWRPLLLWPKGLQDELTAEGRRAVIVHELAHLARKDHWFRWLEMFAAVLHWWNPLFWMARRQMRFHAELACDAWVTATLPDYRRAYAEALLEVCARTTRAAAPAPAVGVGGEGRRDFQRRLTMIMRDRVPCRLAGGAKLFLVLLAIAALPAWTLGQAKPASGIAVTAEGESQPRDSALAIELNDQREIVALAFVDAGAAEDQKIKEIEARIADLTRQLRAMHDAKAAAEQLKNAQPLRFTIRKAIDEKTGRVFTLDANGKVIDMDVRIPPPMPHAEFFPAREHGIRIIRTTSDGRIVEIAEDGKGARWALERTGNSTKPEEKKPVRIIIIGPDGKVTEVEGNIKSEKPGPQTIKPPVPATESKQPQIRLWGSDGKELKIQIDPLSKPVPPSPAVAPAPAVPSYLRPLPQAHFELKLDDARKPVQPPAARYTTLTRATYSLPKAQAEALATFLKANLKTSSMELRIDGDGLTVTAPSDIQSTVSGVVKLMQGGEPIRLRLTTPGAK